MQYANPQVAARSLEIFVKKQKHSSNCRQVHLQSSNYPTLLQDDNAAAFNDIVDPALNNPEFSMDMGYNQETSY